MKKVLQEYDKSFNEFMDKNEDKITSANIGEYIELIFDYVYDERPTLCFNVLKKKENAEIKDAKKISEAFERHLEEVYPNEEEREETFKTCVDLLTKYLGKDALKRDNLPTFQMLEDGGPFFDAYGHKVNYLHIYIFDESTSIEEFTTYFENTEVRY
ncbi:hypothetical protein NPA07_01000 [Mycoplasmopsis caviae]|uniref:Uncharacterized protein n=1 Tax=Mycoplasmopsis caviae TaxID=55603 RepID=A0A3P8MEI4_9BACT|nr:hypothetical protein [Mycoplasmopsis caviae]UUD35437.1 hypothetical protein NPA07_01000 [Mycoplasmopsis caviae]VDR41786.1 Uncharacterised protein [Mycoplasmopsis caviae]